MAIPPGLKPLAPMAAITAELTTPALPGVKVCAIVPAPLAHVLSKTPVLPTNTLNHHDCTVSASPFQTFEAAAVADAADGVGSTAYVPFKLAAIRS